MNNLISVIIPVYNAGKYIHPCLDSIINQTYKNIEILLIDDGSTDDSGKICDDYAEKDTRICVFHKPNGGVSSARNLGLEKATGEWVSFVDSDDFLELNTYETVIKKAQEQPCDIIMYEFCIDDVRGSHPHHLTKEWYGVLTNKQAMKHTDAKVANGFPCTRFFRRSLVYGENLLGKSQALKDSCFSFPLRFDETIARGEDSIFITQIIHCSAKILSIPDVFYHYVQSEESACRGRFRTNQLTFLKLKDFYIPFYQRYYPERANLYYASFCDLILGIYFDMYNDTQNLKKEMNMVFEEFCICYPKSKNGLDAKQKIKFMIFRISPKVFCFIHKIIWRIK